MDPNDPDSMTQSDITNHAAQLTGLRIRIDALDSQLQELLCERGRLAQEAGRIKASMGVHAACQYRPAREAQVLRAIKARNKGPFSDEVIVRLMREILSACLYLESPLQVAYLGPAGTFTQAAAAKHFGGFAEQLPMRTIAEVFRAVEGGQAHFGVVPIENSTEGVVTHTLDLFVRSPLRICGEVEVVVHQCLLGHVDQGTSTDALPIGRIERVLAHEQSLAQCRQFLERHLSRAERIAVSSNAEAARLAAEHPTWAALGSRSAADVYGLAVLAANVEDDPNNTTRFLIIGHNDPEPTGHDKTSLLLATRNESGALYGLLEPLARHGLSMVRIESRPSHRDPWDYHFFLDIEGHAAEARLAGALEEIKQKAIFFKLLGSYPSAVS